jgi:glycosyltransferase involved in cell wall biosynthesis
MQRVVFDITSLVRMTSNIPHGLIRVEAAFAEALLLDWQDAHVFYVHRTSLGYLAKLPRSHVVRILDSCRGSTINIKLTSERLDRILNRWCRPFLPFFFKKSDLYVNVGGLDQLPKNRVLAKSLRSQRILFTAFCHDLIPVKHPYLVKSCGFRTRYQAGLETAAVAELILCNSESTRLDFYEYLSDRHWLPIPEVAVIQLASDKLDAIPQLQEDFSALDVGNYILCVGTITERKNQDLLLNIWSWFTYEDRLKNVKLVLVGPVGGCAEIETRKLELDPRIISNVIHFKTVTDSGLAWLYENCMFTVYPSLYEGWGLPIGESLAYGKVCIASSTSSLVEAGQGLCLHIDPLDFMTWYHTVTQLILDSPRRLALEAKIRSTFKARSWHQVGAEFKALLTHRLSKRRQLKS